MCHLFGITVLVLPLASQLGHLAGCLADGGRGRVELLAGEEIVVERGRRERCAGVDQVPKACIL